MKNYIQKFPHLQSSEAIYFLTYRLYGSMPTCVIADLQEEFEKKLKKIGNNLDKITTEYVLRKQLLVKYDEFLDSNLNEPYWLKG